MRKSVDRFRYEYQEMPDPVMGVAESAELTDFEAQTFSRYGYEGVVGESRRILGRINEAIDERWDESSGVYAQMVVLGVEDYLAVDAWIRYDTGGQKCIEDVIDHDIVTVPGRMIHVPRTNERAMMHHLKEIDADD